MCTTGARPVLIWLYPFYHRSLELSHYNDPLTGSVLSLPFPQTISLYFSPSPYLCILIAARSIFIQSPGLCRCSSPLLYHLLQCNHPGLYLAIASKYPPPLCRPVERASGGSSCWEGMCLISIPALSLSKRAVLTWTTMPASIRHLIGFPVMCSGCSKAARRAHSSSKCRNSFCKWCLIPRWNGALSTIFCLMAALDVSARYQAVAV